MSFDARLYPVETDANYTVGPAPTVEDVDGFLYPVSNSLDKEGGADGYLSQERLFLEASGALASAATGLGAVTVAGFAPTVSAGSGGGAITFVGQQTSLQAGRTTDWPSLTFSLSGGLASTPAEGDLVLIQYGIGSDAATSQTPDIITPSGYTAGTLLNTQGVNFSANNRYFYKFMGATPDTSVTLSQTGNVAWAGAVLIMVFRGVDQTTPLDGVTVVTSASTGTSKPDPDPITPNSAGAWIVALGAQAVGAGVDFTAPASGLDSGAFWSVTSPDTKDITVAGGYYSGWTSGSHDISAFQGGVSNANNAQNCFTLVLKPSAGGGGGASASPSAGTVTVTGSAPTASAAVTTEPTLGAVTVAGLAPTASAAVTASPTLGAVTVTGLAPTSAAAVTASPTLGAVTVTGIAPTSAAAVTASPTLGAVTVAGFAPSATTGGAVEAVPGAGVVTVAGFAPTVVAAQTATATPTAGVVTVAGFASFAAAAASVAPSTGVVTITGFAPTATAGSSVAATAEPGTGAVTVTGFAPSVSAGTAIVIVERDDGGEVLKKHIRDKAAAQFKDALEDIREAPKKQRAEAVEAALEALQPIAAGVDYAEGNKALAAISAALGRATIQRDGYLAAVQQAEAEFARLEAIQAKIRKRRRDEAALLLLI